MSVRDLSVEELGKATRWSAAEWRRAHVAVIASEHMTWKQFVTTAIAAGLGPEFVYVAIPRIHVEVDGPAGIAAGRAMGTPPMLAVCRGCDVKWDSFESGWDCWNCGETTTYVAGDGSRYYDRGPRQ